MFDEDASRTSTARLRHFASLTRAYDYEKLNIYLSLKESSSAGTKKSEPHIKTDMMSSVRLCVYPGDWTWNT